MHEKKMISYISGMQVGACIVSPMKKIVAVGHHDNLHTAANEPDSDLKSDMAAKKLDFGK
jgi:deoxycytidylate deaminase